MPNLPVPVSATGLPNRRLFLAAGSAGAVFGALAHAAHASPAVSLELLDLFEAHRAAEEAYSLASIQEDEAFLRFKDVKNAGDFTRQWPVKWRCDLNDPAGSRAELLQLLAIDKQSLCGAVDHSFGPMRRKFFDLWKEHVEDVLKAFDDLAARVAASKEKADYSRAEARTEQALKAADAIFLQICAWPCASIAEIQAKAKHLLERLDDMENERIEALLHSLAGRPTEEG